MRKSWICQRRFRRKTCACLLVVLCATMFTLPTIFSNTPAVVGSHLKSQLFVLHHNLIYLKEISRNNQYSTTLYQSDHIKESSRLDNYGTVQYSDIMHIQHESNQNMAKNANEINKVTLVPSYSSGQSFRKSNSPITLSSNTAHSFNQGETISLEQTEVDLPDVTNYIPHHSVRKISAKAFRHLIDPAPDNGQLLRAISHDIPQRERPIFEQALNELSNSKNLLNTSKSEHSLNHTTEVVPSYTDFPYSNHTEKVDVNYKKYNTQQYLRHITNSIVNRTYINIGVNNSDNITSRISLIKNNLTPVQSDLNKDAKFRSDSVMASFTSFSRTQHIKNQLPAMNEQFGSSRDISTKDNPSSFSSIVNGIYWSDEVEASIPKGISNQAADEWIARSRLMELKSLQASSWNKCGRPKNAFGLLMDGTETCVRYRSPIDRLVQGEIMSYWLARLLGLDNIAPVYLSSIDSSQWSRQQHRFQELGWTSGNYVAIIMWLEEIDSRPETHVLMPRLLLKAYRQRRPINESDLTFQDQLIGNKNASKKLRGLAVSTMEDLITVAQWGSMIIFDYLTGNYDRVASMQDGAEKERKPSIIEESIRNLRKSKKGGKLWLIDNESGLFDAYELMFLSPEIGRRFVRFHDKMLRTMCIFQKRVVSGLRSLHSTVQAHIALENYSNKHEPLLKLIEKDSSYDLFKKHFSQRLDAVVKWISYCEHKTR